MDEIFKQSAAGMVSLALAEERELIAKAQAGDPDAVWQLLLQYRGILRKTSHGVQTSARGLTPERIEDLQADLVLAAVEAIKSFDLERYVRLSQVLPAKLKDTAMEMATALVVPRGTLALWFKVWRAGDLDPIIAEDLAPSMGMSADTFRAIRHALDHADSEWTNVPYEAGVPTADDETYRLAHYALSLLTPAERSVIELVYGFSGEPKADEEVSLILDSTKGTVKTQRQRALAKMRDELVV